MYWLIYPKTLGAAPAPGSESQMIPPGLCPVHISLPESSPHQPQSPVPTWGKMAACGSRSPTTRESIWGICNVIGSDWVMCLAFTNHHGWRMQCSDWSTTELLGQSAVQKQEDKGRRSPEKHVVNRRRSVTAYWMAGHRHPPQRPELSQIPEPPHLFLTSPRHSRVAGLAWLPPNF